MRKYIYTAITTFLAIILSGCTTNYPNTVGGIGGGVAGAGIGAAIGRSSSSISVAKGLGVGAAVGIPVGILVAHTSDSIAKYYIISANQDMIKGNYDQIIFNQMVIDEIRQGVALDTPRGLPDEDLAEYIYVGPSLGNPWR